MKQQKVYVGAVVIAVIAFFIGMQFGKSSSAGDFAAQGGRGGQFGGVMSGAGGARRGGASGGLVAGEVLSKDDTSVIVKSRDGSSKIVLYSGTTQVMKSTQGSIADVTTGEQVTVIGAANADGSITAQSIQLRPAMPLNSPVVEP